MKYQKINGISIVNNFQLEILYSKEQILNKTFQENNFPHI